MIKGYTVEVIKRNAQGRGYGSDLFHYDTEEKAREAMKTVFSNKFCILTEWAQFNGGFGDYEIELCRQNW